MTDFQKDILSGIPDVLPDPKPYDHSVNHAPKRKDILTPEEKQLALRNALRYFPAKFHETLAPEFAATHLYVPLPPGLSNVRAPDWGVPGEMPPGRGDYGHDPE